MSWLVKIFKVKDGDKDKNNNVFRCKQWEAIRKKWKYLD